MKKRKWILWRAAIALGAVAAATAPALTQRPARTDALAKLQAGLWQLRDLDSRAELPPVCLGDPNLLVQLKHRSAACSRIVVAENRGTATVHYTCPAAGYGQTLIRIETPRLAQIETQGIADNRPFSSRIQARRVGNCATN
jgi:hypothetical protein